MAEQGERVKNAENVIDLVAGPVLILFGLIAGLSGNWAIAAVLALIGIGVLVSGILKRNKRASRSPQTPTT